MTVSTKPLGGKAYGHIPHLPGSRMGPGDHHCHEGQARICTERARDRHDRITVTEKLDGSATAVCRVEGQILALGRAGWLAQASPYEQHQLFAAWVRGQEERFREVLEDGERLVGEWLAQAHGTRYALAAEPWVVFDLMRGDQRAPREELLRRAGRGGLLTPRLLHEGGPCSIAQALDLLERVARGATDPVAQDPMEGAVWRVERRGLFDFLAKYVKPGKVDGAYLPEVSGQPAVWNWRPPAAHP